MHYYQRIRDLREDRNVSLDYLAGRTNHTENPNL